mmetsp:Transcript_76629/g.183583  ORF Transcript_76629/g.183583 Transcript_76629/m.183583 type:complete len:216 (-) Transcript_76629:280-927(-)
MANTAGNFETAGAGAAVANAHSQVDGVYTIAVWRAGLVLLQRAVVAEGAVQAAIAAFALLVVGENPISAFAIEKPERRALRAHSMVHDLAHLGFPELSVELEYAVQLAATVVHDAASRAHAHLKGVPASEGVTDLVREGDPGPEAVPNHPSVRVLIPVVLLHHAHGSDIGQADGARNEAVVKQRPNTLLLAGDVLPRGVPVVKGLQLLFDAEGAM